MAVFFLTDRSLQRNWLTCDFQNLPHFVERQVHAFGDFLRGRFPPEFLDQMTRGSNQFVDRLYHMDWDTDGPCLIGNRAGNSLANPPGGIGTELVAALVLKLIHGLHQANIAFLDQVKELKAPVRIFLGDTDNETKIRLNQFGLPTLDLVFRYI